MCIRLHFRCSIDYKRKRWIKMFWILLIGIIIVSCVLKEEDSSGSSSDKHSSTVTSKTRATKTLNVPYPYSAIKRMEVPVYIRETGINNKIATDILTKKIIYDEGHHLLVLHCGFGFENRNNFEMHLWKMLCPSSLWFIILVYSSRYGKIAVKNSDGTVKRKWKCIRRPKSILRH